MINEENPFSKLTNSGQKPFLNAKPFYPNDPKLKQNATGKAPKTTPFSHVFDKFKTGNPGLDQSDSLENIKMLTQNYYNSAIAEEEK